MPSAPAMSGPGGRQLFTTWRGDQAGEEQKHSIEIVVDRLIIRPDIRQRLTDSVETASKALRRPGHREPSAGGAGPVLLPELRLRGLRHHHRGADAPDVLLQQPLRRLPHLYRSGEPAEGRPRPHDSGWRSPILDGAIQASGWNNIRGTASSRMYFDALSKNTSFPLTEPWSCREAEDHPLRHRGGEAGAAL